MKTILSNFLFGFFLISSAASTATVSTEESREQRRQSELTENYEVEGVEVQVADLAGEGPFVIRIRYPSGERVVSYTRSAYQHMVRGLYQGVDLDDLRIWEKFYFDSREFRGMATSELAKLTNTPFPQNTQGRRTSLSIAEINRLAQSTSNHSIVGHEGARRYDPRGDIRYCFGLATYTHHMVLALGLHPDAIRKALIVGPGRWRDGNEGFHMTTVVRGDDGDWYAIDRYFSRAIKITAWFQYFWEKSSDGKLRFFVSDADRFSPAIHTYSSLQLGLDHPRQEDVYKGYFRDLFAWLRNPGNVSAAGFNVIPYQSVTWPNATRDYLLR